MTVIKGKNKKQNKTKQNKTMGQLDFALFSDETQHYVYCVTT